MVIIPDLSEQVIIDSLSDQLNYIENERIREREFMLDFYEGINADDYIKQFFGSESLQQIPVFSQNLTRRVCKARSMSFKRPPKMNADKRYLDLVNHQNLNANRRQLETLTFLLGTMAVKSVWNPMRKKLEYQLLPFFEPLFLPGESEPFGIMYAIQNHGMSRLKKEEFVVWTEARNGYPARHFGLTSDGDKISYNDGDINPYGILPVTFVHRYPPIRDWWTEGASDLVRADLSVSVAMTELALAIRFGAIGIKFVTGVDDRSKISVGVDKILYLPEGSNFGVTAPSGSLSEIISATKFMVSATLTNNHLRIKWADDEHLNAPSGEALRILEIENYEERVASVENTWRQFEHNRFEIDRKILEVRAGVGIPDEYSVDFIEPDYPLTPREDREMWSWKFEHNLARPIDWYDAQNIDAPEEQRNAFLEMQEEVSPQEPGNRLLSRLKS